VVSEFCGPCRSVLLRPWGDWRSYNKTLTSARYSELAEINIKNVERLKLLCTYDTPSP